MIEIATAISAATSAFTAIKKGFEVGRDVESMSKDLGRWMGAVSDINKELSNTIKTTLIQEIIRCWFSRRRKMQIFMAKKESRGHERTIEKYHLIYKRHFPSAWEELLRTEADIRKKRQKAIYDQQERQKEVLNAIGIIFLVLLIAGVIVFGLYTVVQIKGHPSTWF